jgi:hypothetical protein
MCWGEKMKVELNDVLYYEKWNANYWSPSPSVGADAEEKMAIYVKALRSFSKNHSLLHSLLEILPFMILFLTWVGIIFYLPQILDNKVLLFFLLGSLHGIWGYSYVVFSLHEGAGHGLLNGTPLRFLAFHSSRLMFADPIFYKEAHSTHHRHLGTIRDASFTQYVSLKRVLKSLLPGAGILFPNEYKIHQGDQITASLLVSFFVGGLFLSLEVYLLKDLFSWWQILLCFGLFGPWIGFSLDRLRESLEHWGMPQARQYGSKEFGIGLWGLLIGGGPWGQPCHFSHHYAPDLSWYQQLQLHFFLKKINIQLPADFLFKEGLQLKTILKRITSQKLPGTKYGI